MDALLAIAPLEDIKEPEMEVEEVAPVDDHPSLAALEVESKVEPLFDADAPKVTPGEFFGDEEKEAKMVGSITETERIEHQQVVETRTSFTIPGQKNQEETEEAGEETVEEVSESEPESDAKPESEPVKVQPKADYDAWDDAWKEPEPEPKPDRVVKSTDSLNVELEW